MGYRFVLYAPALALEEHRLERDQLQQALGDPVVSKGRLIWDLGPAQPQAHPLPERFLRKKPSPTRVRP